MLGGCIEGGIGLGFAYATAPTVAGPALGIAVGMHGADVANAGFYTMWTGVPHDTLTSQGLQSLGLPQNAATGIDAGISIVGSMGVGITVRGMGTGLQSMNGLVSGEIGGSAAIQSYYPINNGIMGEREFVYLYRGTVIDRYGGGSGSIFFSPAGTPSEMRALPPSSIGAELRIFVVEKPILVEQGVVAPAFNQIGGGIQYRTPVNLGVLLNRGILREIH